METLQSPIGDILIGGGTSDTTLYSSALTSNSPFIAYILDGGVVAYANIISGTSMNNVIHLKLLDPSFGSSDIALAVVDQIGLVFFTFYASTGALISVYKDSLLYNGATNYFDIQKAGLSSYLRGTTYEYAIGYTSPDGYGQVLFYDNSTNTFGGFKSVAMPDSHMYTSSISSVKVATYSSSKYMALISGYQVNVPNPFYYLSAIDISSPASMSVIWSYAPTSIDKWNIQDSDIFQDTSTNLYVFACSNLTTVSGATSNLALHYIVLNTATSMTMSEQIHYSLSPPTSASCSDIAATNSSSAYYLLQVSPNTAYCKITFPSSSQACINIQLSSTFSSNQQTTSGSIYYTSAYNVAYIVGYAKVTGPSSTYPSTGSQMNGFIATSSSGQSCSTTAITYPAAAYTFTNITSDLLTKILNPSFVLNSLTFTISSLNGCSTSQMTILNLLSNTKCHSTPLANITKPTLNSSYSICQGQSISVYVFNSSQTSSSCIDVDSFTYTIQQTDSTGNVISGVLPSYITLTTNTSFITVSIGSAAPVGVVYLGVTGTLPQPYLSTSINFTINVENACQCATITCNSSCSPSPLYSVGSATYNSGTQFPLFQVSVPNCNPTCTLSYQSWSSTLPSSSFTFTQKSSTPYEQYQTSLSSLFTSSDSYEGTYGLNISCTIPTYLQQATTSFNFTILSSCASTIVTLIPNSTLPTNYAFDSTQTGPILLFTAHYSVSSSTCLSYTCSFSVSNSSQFSFTNDSSQVSVSTNILTMGSYNGTLSMTCFDSKSVVFNTTTTSIYTVNIVDSCGTYPIVPRSVSSVNYSIGIDSTDSVTFSDWYISGSLVACPSFTYTAEILNPDGSIYSSSIGATYTTGGVFVQFYYNGAAYQFDVRTTDFTQVGTYTVIITGKVTLTSSSRQSTSNFTVELLDGCLSADYIQTPLASSFYTYTLRSMSPTVITIPAFTSNMSDLTCGSFDSNYFAYSVGGATIDANYFTFDYTSMTFTVDSTLILPSSCGTIPVQACTFNFQVTGYQGTHVRQYPSVSITYFSVIITDPCINPSFTPSSPIIWSYTIGDAQETITVSQSDILTKTNSGNCGAYTSYAASQVGTTSNPIVFTYNPGTLILQVYSYSVSQAGLLQYNISRGLSDYVGIRGYSYDLIFNVTLIDPCLNATYSRIDMNTQNYDYSLRQGAYLISSIPSLQSSLLNALCGNFTQWFTNENGSALNASFFTQITIGEDIELQVDLNSPLPASCNLTTSMPHQYCIYQIQVVGYQGTYTWKLYPILPSSVLSSYFNVTLIDPCYNTTINQSGVTSLTYTIGTGVYPFYFGTFTANAGNCGNFEPYTFVRVSNQTNISSILTYNSSTLHSTGVDIYSNWVADAGVYSFSVTVTLSDYKQYASGSLYQITVNYTLTLLNPCPIATYSQPILSVTYYEYQLRYSALLINFTDYSSSQSNSLCGNFIYLAVNTDNSSLNSSYFTFNSSNKQLKVYFNTHLPTVNDLPVQSQLFYIQIQGYQGIYSANRQPVYNIAYITVNLTDTCYNALVIPTQITPPIGYYMVKESAANVTFVNFTVVDSNGTTDICGAMTYSPVYLNVSTSFQSKIFSLVQTSSKNTFYIQTQNESAGGIYQVQLIGTLSFYQISNSFTFSYPICSMNLPSTSDLTYIIETSAVSFLIPPSTDPTITQCPQLNYTYKVNKTLALATKVFNTSILSNYSTEFTVNTSDTTIANYYNISYSIGYNKQNYSSYFGVTVNCEVFYLTYQAIKDQTYVVGPLSLTFTYHEFAQYPKCSNEIEYVAKLTGTASLPSFISLNSKTKTFTVQTNDDSNVGVYSINVQATTNNKDGTLAYNSDLIFQLTLLKGDSSSSGNASVADISVNVSTDTFNSTQKEDQGNQNKLIQNNPIIITESTALVATIQSISSSGLMTVSFNEIVKVPSNYTGFNSSELNITLIPTSEIDPSYLQFTWKIVGFSTSGMQVQLNFSYPLQVSVRLSFMNQPTQQNKVQVNLAFLSNSTFLKDQHLTTSHYSTGKIVPALVTNTGKYISSLTNINSLSKCRIKQYCCNKQAFI